MEERAPRNRPDGRLADAGCLDQKSALLVPEPQIVPGAEASPPNHPRRAEQVSSKPGQSVFHPLTIEVAVFPEVHEPLVVLAGLVHLAAVLVDLAQEVEAAHVGNGPVDVLGGAFRDAPEPCHRLVIIVSAQVSRGQGIPDGNVLRQAGPAGPVA